MYFYVNYHFMIDKYAHKSPCNFYKKKTPKKIQSTYSNLHI
jgi:hypothetical protein